MTNQAETKGVLNVVKEFFEQEEYPEFSFCFKESAIEIAKKPDCESYRLIQLIVKPGGKDIIKKLENLIRKVRSDILDISPAQFVELFGIDVSWLVGDRGTFSDILAEMAVCAELYKKGGFRNWEKLPRKKKPSGDYSAIYGEAKFLIEVKHIRENKVFEEKSRAPELMGWYNVRELWKGFSDFVTSDTILGKATVQLNATPGFQRLLVYAHGRDMISTFGNEDDFKDICYKIKEKVGDKIDYVMFMSLKVEDTYPFSLNGLETS